MFWNYPKKQSWPRHSARDPHPFCGWIKIGTSAYFKGQFRSPRWYGYSRAKIQAPSKYAITLQPSSKPSAEFERLTRFNFCFLQRTCKPDINLGLWLEQKASAFTAPPIGHCRLMLDRTVCTVQAGPTRRVGEDCLCFMQGDVRREVICLQLRHSRLILFK